MRRLAAVLCLPLLCGTAHAATPKGTPVMIVLPNEALVAGMDANWWGLIQTWRKPFEDRDVMSSLEPVHPIKGGIVAGKRDDFGVPFNLTEFFSEVYRLHSLLPETLKLRRIGAGEQAEELPFAETRQAGSSKVTSRMPMADLLYSFGNQHPGQLVLNNFPRFMQELSIPGNPLFDMGAVDILRARERGVPRYNEFRRQLGLNPIASFDDLTDDQEQVQALKTTSRPVESSE